MIDEHYIDFDLKSYLDNCRCLDRYKDNKVLNILHNAAFLRCDKLSPDKLDRPSVSLFLPGNNSIELIIFDDSKDNGYLSVLVNKKVVYYAVFMDDVVTLTPRCIVSKLKKSDDIGLVKVKIRESNHGK